MKDGSSVTISINGVPAWVIVLGLFILGLVVVLTPWLLARLYKKSHLMTEDAAGNRIPTSFFQLPYITWFLIHLLVPFLGILAVVGLALARALDPATTATLLSGLFGFVLGSAAKGHADVSKPAAKDGTSGNARDSGGDASA